MLKKVSIILVLLLVFSVLLGSLLYWLELVNVLPSRVFINFFDNITNESTPTLEIESVSDTLLLEKIRLEKQYEAIQTQQQNLVDFEQTLVQREQEIVKKEEIIRMREEELDNQELSLNQRAKTIDNKTEGVRYNTQALLNMPPRSAVRILEGYEDQQLIDTLLIADQIANENNTQSLVPFWLSLMDPVKVAEIQAKITYR